MIYLVKGTEVLCLSGWELGSFLFAKAFGVKFPLMFLFPLMSLGFPRNSFLIGSEFVLSDESPVKGTQLMCS